MFRHWHRFTHLLSTIILFAVALLPLGAPQAVQAAVQPALVKDIAAGAASSEPRILAEINGLVLFEAFDATNGWQLWSSDGTAAGTILLTDLSSENESISFNITRRIAEYAGSFYFMSGGPTKRKLWRSDGTVAGTRQVGTVQPRGPDGLNRPIQGIVFQNKLYFITQSLPSQEYSSTLWVTDGTDAGTTPINYPGSDADVLYDMVVAGNKLFFSVFDKSWEDEDGSERMTLYSTDGTAAGTVVLRSGENANIGNMTALNNKLLFNSYDPATGQELWSSDGTVAGTGIVKETSAGSFGSVSELVKLGSLVLFTTNPSPAKNLWRSDGTAAGTYRIKEFTSSVSGGWSLPNGAVGPGNYFYFFANDGQVGSELWRSDGSAAGTTLVKDTVPGPANSQAGSIFANNGLLYFIGRNASNQSSLWRSDGTPAGTYIIKENIASFGQFAALGDGISFAIETSLGRELWYSEGSAASTEPLVDPVSGQRLLLSTAFPFNVNELAYAGKAGTTSLFGASNGQVGFELWRLNASIDERVTDGLLAFYDFEEGSGNTIYDTSGVGTALDLRVARSFNHQWVDGGLRLNGSPVLRSRGAATKLIASAKANNAFTIEAWVKPADVEQFSARIVTISPNATVRNVTLTQGSFQRQDSSEAILRLRTTFSASGSAGLELTSGSGALSSELAHVVTAVGSDGAIKIYIDGILLRTYTQPGTLANWNTSYPLLLGNEALGERGWKGTYYLVAFYDRALSAAEVAQNYAVGP